MEQLKIIKEKAVRILVGTILGLILSFFAIVVSKMIFRCPIYTVNLWLVAVLISVSELLCIWLMLKIRFKRKRQFVTNGFDQLPVEASQFIDAIISSMKYRHRASSAVRQELTDHFTDALNGCSAKEDEKEYVDEIIKEFGDIDILAKLLKRGKKRCSTPVQKALRVVKWIVIFIVVYPFWVIAVSFLVSPKADVNYLEQWNSNMRLVAEDSLNAEPIYALAAQAYSFSAIEKKQAEENEQEVPNEQRIDTNPQSLSAVSDENMLTIKQWLKDNEQAIELIKQGNTKPFYWRQYQTGDSECPSLIAGLIPNLSEYREVARIMCWQALFYADAGKFSEAFDEIENVYILGKNIKGKKTALIEQLVGIAIKGITNNTLRIILHENYDQINAEQLAVVSDCYKQLITGDNFIVDYSGEKYCLYDEVQRCFINSWVGPDYLYIPRIDMLAGGEIMDFDNNGIKFIPQLISHPGKKQTIAAIEQLDRLYAEAAKKTPATRNNEKQSLDDAVVDIAHGNIFLNILMPALGKVMSLSYRNKTDAQATQVIIALMQYKKQFSKYPENLNELVVMNLLDELPIDPFSDKPLIYKKTDDDFILYSVGYDFRDDGGAKKQNRNEGDWLYWPIEVENE